MAQDPNLNPAQQAVLDRLGAGLGVDDRPEFSPDLRDELRADLEGQLAPVADVLRVDRPLTVDKRMLAGVHGCEVRFRHEQGEPFTLSVANVRGTVVHKAVELAVNWGGNPPAGTLVDEAIGRIANADHWAADWLATTSAAERAEVRSAAGATVAKFLECWPPLDRSMRPATEVSMRADLCGGRILLKGRADLTLGQPVDSGNKARKVIVDFKSGGFAPAHRDDLRFYALVETLRIGVPPRLLVSAYLDSATDDCEVVTEAMLRSAVARLVDGVHRYAALRTGEAAPVRRPSTACRWCSLLVDCPEGNAHLEDTDPFGPLVAGIRHQVTDSVQ